MVERAETVDLVVLGSGAGGLTAALVSALAGLSVIVLEHSDHVGGTSARSSGTVWVPDNHLMRAEGVMGDGARAATYLENLTDDHAAGALWRVFLENASAMVRDLEANALLQFRPYVAAPDYRQDIAGAAPGGRPLEPLPFDGRELGADFDRLASPLRELMVFGGMMVTRSEAASLLKADRSLSSVLLGVRLVVRYLADRLRYRRGTRLVLGNALVARLMKAALDRGVDIVTNAEPQDLLTDSGRVTGVRYRLGGETREIRARRGVVLAGGGFPANPDWRKAHMPAPAPEYTPAAPGCDGSTIALALKAGAVLGPSSGDNALWFPSSVSTRVDGSVAVYPHIVLDRAKPGLIAVNQDGERFVNEACSYHQFVRAQYAANADTPAIPAWLVCDRKFLGRYGLGLIRPRTPFVGRYIRTGYLKRGRSLSELAAAIGVSAGSLEATVRRYNRFAGDGIDHDFHKGETIYDRSNGDPAVAPNPCIGRIETGPFYAVAVHPTPLGTSLGLRADANARVLDAGEQPVAGLYVCGNDMHSAFNGEYPGAGAQLGQAMTFGWIAGRHAARVSGKQF